MEIESQNVAVLCLAILFAISVLIFYKWRLTTQKLSAESFQCIDSCKSNEYCKVQGVLELASEKIVAPLSSRSCAAYHVTVREYLRQYFGTSNFDSKEIINDMQITNFLVNDGVHYAYVLSYNAELLLSKDKILDTGHITIPTKELNAYLTSFNRKATKAEGLPKGMASAEGVLEKGGQVSICGVGSWLKTKEFVNLEFFVKIGKE